MFSRLSIKVPAALLCLISISIFSSCALFELKDELKELDATYRLSGKLLEKSNTAVDSIAVLYKADEDGIRIFDCAIIDPEGHYTFLAPPRGVYYLVVFDDANQNFIYDDGENFGFANQSRPIVLNQEKSAATGTNAVPKRDTRLTENSGFRSDLPTFVDIGTISGKTFIKVGVVTTLDDPAFDQENGYLGYWKPLTFLRTVGAGLYFLEEFDPKKIPVLFVHGANGTPVGWKPLVAQLDRSKYQPWFFYYPSGLRIDPIAER